MVEIHEALRDAFSSKNPSVSKRISILKVYLMKLVGRWVKTEIQRKIKSPPHFKMLLLVKVLQFHNRPTVLT